MNAATPLSPSTMDQKPREPSMEEILASIRRIIADDQFPRHVSAPEPSPLRPTVAPDEPPTVVPVPAQEPVVVDRHEAPRAGFHHPEVVADARQAEASSSYAEPYDPTYGHGSITPQYPVPPVADDSAPAAMAGRMEPAPLPGWHHHAEVPEPMSHPSEPELEVASLHGHPSTAATQSAHPALDEAEEHDDAAYETPLAPAREPEPEAAPALFSTATDTAVSSAFNMLAATRLADNSEELKGMVREMIRPLLRSWLDDNLPTMVERMVRAEIERVARGGR